MRILDRYAARQLFPVWLWCLLVFMFLSCLIDLFEHLDDILRYHIPAAMMLQYYLNFLPIVFVRASPLALLLSAAFVATRLSRYQELLAMNASGTSLLRASVPFLFIGWLVALCVFFVNDRVVPHSSLIYDQIRRQVFRSPDEKPESMANVAALDAFNRLYHARAMDPNTKELYDVTILEHDANNQLTKSLYVSRAVWTKFGWLLLNGTISRIGPHGVLRGDPEPFVERLMAYPVTPEQFAQPEPRLETMRFSQLRLLIARLKQIRMANVQRYTVELMAKLTLPLMNLIVCLIAFAGSTQPQLRGNLRGLGMSLGWGLLYYFLVGFGEGVGKKGMFLVPTFVAVWAPHLLAIWWSLRLLGRTP